MAADPNVEWLSHLQPVGLVVAPNVLADQGLVPAEQTRADTEEYRALLTETGPALSDPWQLASTILEWPASSCRGRSGRSPLLPENELRAYVPEAETELVSRLGGGEARWRLAGPGPASADRDRARSARSLARLGSNTPPAPGAAVAGDRGAHRAAAYRDDRLASGHAPRGETSGQITFPLRPMGTVAGRPMLGGLKLLLDRTRLFTDAPNKRLPAILAASRDAQAAVSTALAGQVLGALHELLRGLHAADPERLVRLTGDAAAGGLRGSADRTAATDLPALCRGPRPDPVPHGCGWPRALQRSYGVRGLHARLRQDAARNPDTMDERYGAWGRLLATFRLVHTGDGTGWIRGRGGKLFDPARFPIPARTRRADRSCSRFQPSPTAWCCACLMG